MSINSETTIQSNFPIGKLTKKEVREIAKKNDLITAEKKTLRGYVLLVR